MGLLLPSLSSASALLPACAGTADGATACATVAQPLSPLGAQFANPAGLAGFTERQGGLGLGLAYGAGQVTASAPAGYQATNHVLVPFLDSYLVVPKGEWTFGIGSMGTSGARFQYGARPAVGVKDGFFSESGVMAVPVGAAWRVSDSLWLGAQLAPLYATTHLRYSTTVAESPGAATPFRFSVKGFGVQSAVGLTWMPDERWALGLGFKPPGRIWTKGDTAFAGGRQNVRLELEAPLEVALGLSRSIASRWKVSYALRYTDTSVLGTSYLRFRATPSANAPFVAAARDEWRHAIGVAWAWTDSLTLLGGFAKANGIVGARGVSPMSFDTRDFRLDAGLRRRGAKWTLDGAFGYIFAGTSWGRGALPGRYEAEPAYLLSITVSRAF